MSFLWCNLNFLGFPDYYATSDGYIYSQISNKILTGAKSSKGYSRVTLVDETGGSCGKMILET